MERNARIDIGGYDWPARYAILNSIGQLIAYATNAARAEQIRAERCPLGSIIDFGG